MSYRSDGHKGSDSISEWLHGGLDGLGLIPGLGVIPDALNAAFYVIEGNFPAAGMSAAAMVPIFGHGATAAKYALTVSKEAAERTARRIGAQGRRQAAGLPGDTLPVNKTTAGLKSRPDMPAPQEDAILTQEVANKVVRDYTQSSVWRSARKQMNEAMVRVANTVPEERIWAAVEDLKSRAAALGVAIDYRGMAGDLGTYVRDGRLREVVAGSYDAQGRTYGLAMQGSMSDLSESKMNQLFRQNRHLGDASARRFPSDGGRSESTAAVRRALREDPVGTIKIDSQGVARYAPVANGTVNEASFHLYLLLHELYHHAQHEMFGVAHMDKIARAGGRGKFEVPAEKWAAIQLNRFAKGLPFLSVTRSF